VLVNGPILYRKTRKLGGPYCISLDDDRRSMNTATADDASRMYLNDDSLSSTYTSCTTYVVKSKPYKIKINLNLIYRCVQWSPRRSRIDWLLICAYYLCGRVDTCRYNTIIFISCNIIISNNICAEQ